MIEDRHDKRPWTVLIVDDEPDVRQFLQRSLERNIPGLRTITADNGKDGLQMLAHDDVDLILSDHRMPVMEGTEFLAHAAKVAPDVPRILLTGFADVATAVQAVNEGRVSAFFQKPTSADELSNAVLRLLQIRAATIERHVAFARGIEIARKRAAPFTGLRGDAP